MRKLVFSMLFLSIAQSLFAQKDLGTPYPKQLENMSRYYLDLGKGNVLLIGSSLEQLKQYQNIDSVLTLFLKDYAAVKPTFKSETSSKTLRYAPYSNGKHLLEATEHLAPKERYQFSLSDDPIQIKTLQDTLLIVRRPHKGEGVPPYFETYAPNISFETYFYFILNNLNDVQELVLSGMANAKIKQALSDAALYKNHDISQSKYKFVYFSNRSAVSPEVQIQTSVDSAYANKVNTFTANRRFFRVQKHYSPFLALHPSVGVGIVQGQISPNIQYDMAFVPSKYHNVGYTLGWRRMYFVNRDSQTDRFQTQHGGFVQVGLTFYDFRRPSNVSRRYEVNTDQVIGGIYFGFLASQRGDYFRPNTMNLSATLVAKGFVKIQPEVYFTQFFKNATPGLRIQFGF